MTWFPEINSGGKLELLFINQCLRLLIYVLYDNISVRYQVRYGRNTCYPYPKNTTKGCVLVLLFNIIVESIVSALTKIQFHPPNLAYTVIEVKWWDCPLNSRNWLKRNCWALRSNTQRKIYLFGEKITACLPVLFAGPRLLKLCSSGMIPHRFHHLFPQH